MLLLLAACGGRIAVESSSPEVADATAQPDPDASSADASLSDAAPGDATAADGGTASLYDGPADAPADANDTALLSHCLQGGNVMYVDGDPGEQFHPGPLLLAQGAATFTSTIDLPMGVAPPGATTVALYADPSAPPTDRWAFVFTTAGMGERLRAQRYDPLEPFIKDYKHAEMRVILERKGVVGCMWVAGWFDVTTLDLLPDSADAGPDSIVAFTAAFEQHCDGVSPALRGCIHYARP